MNAKTLKSLNTLRDLLNDTVETNCEKILDLIKSDDLQTDFQTNVVNYIIEVVEEIDNIVESIESGEYDNNANNEDEY
jgi:hypothetical protein